MNARRIKLQHFITVKAKSEGKTLEFCRFRLFDITRLVHGP